MEPPTEPTATAASSLDRHSILTRGWEQGAIIAPDMLVPATDGRPWSGAVVVTQSCDILHERLEAEPFIEVLPFVRHDRTPTSTFERAQHPRILEFAHSGGAVNFVVHDRQFLDRRVLANPSVTPVGRLAADDLDLLLNWLVDRYVRPALPEELGRRLSERKLRESVDGQRSLVSKFFVSVDPLEEIAPHDIYSVGLRLVVRAEHRGNKPAEKKVRDLVKRLMNRFAHADNIIIPDSPDWPRDGSAPSTAQMESAVKTVLRYDDEMTIAELDYWIQFSPEAISHGVALPGADAANLSGAAHLKSC